MKQVDKSRILVVDDESMIVRLFQMILSASMPGIVIDAAANGLAALDKFRTNHYAVILMDLHMPIKNGYQAALEIREYEKTGLNKTPAIIIALSADVTTGVQDKCMQNGMNGYLQKPFKTYDIRNILKKYLSTSVQDKNPETTNLDNLPHEFIRKDLMDRLNGNIPLFQKLAEVAISQLSSDIENLKKSIEKSDLSAVKMSNHSIKGVSLNLYFSRLAELAKKIEGEYQDL